MKEKNPFSMNRLGLCLVCLFSLIIVIALNLLADRIPDSIAEFDISSTGLYSFSRQTKEVLESLEMPVTLNLIAESGKEDAKLVRLLKKYEDGSSFIAVRTIDPVLQPDFVTQYTSNRVSNNSILVTGENDRVRLLRNSDLFPSSYDTATGSVSTDFDGEGQITAAIRDMTGSSDSNLYLLTGHGEEKLPDKVVSAAQKEGLHFSSLNLLTVTEIPIDASGVLCFAPIADFRKQEAEMLESYLQSGGRFLLVTSNTSASTSVLESCMASYGLSSLHGLIMERQADYYVPTYPTLLLPNIQESDMTAPFLEDGSLVLMPNAHGIAVSDAPGKAVQVLPLLKTSQSSYLKAPTATTYNYESGDASGPFQVAVALTEETGTAETRIVWISSSRFLNEEFDEMVSGNNTDLFLNVLSWLSKKESSITIRAKPQTANRIRLTSAQARLWSAVFVIVLPLVTLAIGIIVTVKRRRRI